jgi:hypothetical protein
MVGIRRYKRFSGNFGSGAVRIGEHKVKKRTVTIINIIGLVKPIMSNPFRNTISL